MKTKEERKDIAFKEYEKVRDLAWEEFEKVREEIDNEKKIKCSKCGK